MPSRKVDSLHVPYKFYVRDRPTVRDALVHPAELDRALLALTKRQADNHRQNWLELERWTDRLRDHYTSTIPLPPVPTVSRATFTNQTPRPVSNSGLSGWPGTSPSPPGIENGWQTDLNQDPARYFAEHANFAVPHIMLPGVYRVHTYNYWEVAGGANPPIELAEIQTNVGGSHWYIENPVPGAATNAASVPYGQSIEASHVKTVVVTQRGATIDYHSELIRLGLFVTSSSTSRTSAGVAQVTFMRLPIAYP